MAFPSPINSAHYLENASPAITASRNGSVSGSARVFDTASGAWSGFLIFNPTALDTATGNETYVIKLQVSNSPTFVDSVPLPTLNATQFSVAAVGEQAVLFDNTINGVTYRYIRIRIEVAGTTPSMALQAWLIKESDLDSLSLAQLVRVMSVSVARFTETTADFRNWVNGSATGGPSSNGQYPLSDGAGNTVLVACPAKTAATALSKASFQAIPLHTTPLASPFDPVPQILGIKNPGNVGGTEALVRFPLDLFASRKTSDLAETPVLIGTELIPAINASTGVEGKVAFTELYRRVFGTINPTLPPYNCKFDGVFHKQGITTTSGSRIVEANEPIFSRALVNHKFQCSNGAAGGQPLKSTITSVLDAYRVQIAATCGHSQAGQDCLFGTDDTAGMQAALDACVALSTFTYGKILLCPPGMCLTGALRYHPRTGIFGRGIRQTTFLRYDDGALSVPIYGYYGDNNGNGIINEDDPTYTDRQPAPTLRASTRLCDFNAFGDFALIGARYCQSSGYGGFSAQLEIGARSMPQVDPYPFYSRMHVEGHGWIGWEQGGRHSGSMIGIEIINNGGYGLFLQCYDANVTNILSIGNSGPGVFLEQGQGGNNNVLNAKVSFNGDGSLGYFLDANIAQANFVVEGSGNNFTNMRCQESLGSNMVITGSRNQFGDIGIDDTGNIAYKFGAGPTLVDNLPDVRAAIALGPNASFNRFNDVGYGGAVQFGENYATHGVYHFDPSNTGGGQQNSGRIYTKNVPSYWSDDTGATPGPIGAQGALAPHASNFYTIDEQSIASLYP